MIIDGIKEKKGENVIVIDLKNNPNSPCDFFIICSAKSKVQIHAIANNIEDTLLKKLKRKKWRDEGKQSFWRLMDYSDIVIHILKHEAREYYNLEELWGDSIIQKL